MILLFPPSIFEFELVMVWKSTYIWVSWSSRSSWIYMILYGFLEFARQWISAIILSDYNISTIHMRSHPIIGTICVIIFFKGGSQHDLWRPSCLYLLWRYYPSKHSLPDSLSWPLSYDCSRKPLQVSRLVYHSLYSTPRHATPIVLSVGQSIFI